MEAPKALVITGARVVKVGDGFIAEEEREHRASSLYDRAVTALLDDRVETRFNLSRGRVDRHVRVGGSR